MTPNTDPLVSILPESLPNKKDLVTPTPSDKSPIDRRTAQRRKAVIFRKNTNDRGTPVNPRTDKEPIIHMDELEVGVAYSRFVPKSEADREVFDPKYHNVLCEFNRVAEGDGGEQNPQLVIRSLVTTSGDLLTTRTGDLMSGDWVCPIDDCGKPISRGQCPEHGVVDSWELGRKGVKTPPHYTKSMCLPSAHPLTISLREAYFDINNTTLDDVEFPTALVQCTHIRPQVEQNVGHIGDFAYKLIEKLLTGVLTIQDPVLSKKWTDTLDRLALDSMLEGGDLDSKVDGALKDGLSSYWNGMITDLVFMIGFDDELTDLISKISEHFVLHPIRQGDDLYVPLFLLKRDAQVFILEEHRSKLFVKLPMNPVSVFNSDQDGCLCVEEMDLTFSEDSAGWDIKPGLFRIDLLTSPWLRDKVYNIDRKKTQKIARARRKEAVAV